MPIHLRVDLPDRPGSLAQLTREFAAAGADVLSVHVTDRAGGRVVDDFLLSWPQDRNEEPLSRAVESVPGSRVLGLRRVATIPEENATLDLVTHVLWQPHRAVETLVDLLPAVADADWAAALLRGATGQLLHSSAGAPLPLPALPGDLPRAVAFSHTAGQLVSVPVPGADVTVVLARVVGPPFLRREVDEVARVVELVIALLRALGSSDLMATGPTRRLLNAAAAR